MRDVSARVLAGGLLLIASFANIDHACARKSVDGVSPTALRDTGRLFRISRPGIPDSYVLGTIHVADPRVSALSAPALDAMARCRTLAVELIADSGADLQELEQLDEGRRLDALVGPATYAKVRERVAEMSAVVSADAKSRIDEERIARLRPWAALMLVSRATTTAGSHSPVATLPTLDANILMEAGRRRMKILPLELIEEQVSAFNTIPESTQIALLEHVLANREALVSGASSSVESWLRGDLDALARHGLQGHGRFPAMRPHYAKLVEHIIHGRTALMHHRLHIPLSEGRVFIAIGALHLQGGKGLLTLLREDGYRIARIW